MLLVRGNLPQTTFKNVLKMHNRSSDQTALFQCYNTVALVPSSVVSMFQILHCSLALKYRRGSIFMQASQQTSVPILCYPACPLALYTPDLVPQTVLNFSWMGSSSSYLQCDGHGCHGHVGLVLPWQTSLCHS